MATWEKPQFWENKGPQGPTTVLQALSNAKENRLPGMSDKEHRFAYAVPSDNNNSFPVGGTMTNVITMKKERIFQRVDFCIKHTRDAVLHSRYFGQRKLPGRGTSHFCGLDI